MVSLCAIPWLLTGHLSPQSCNTCIWETFSLRAVTHMALGGQSLVRDMKTRVGLFLESGTAY